MFQVGFVAPQFGVVSVKLAFSVHCGRLTFLELRECAFAKSECFGGGDWILVAGSRVHGTSASRKHMPAAACDNRSDPTESLSREQACENDSFFKSRLQALVSNSRALLGASHLGIPNGRRACVSRFN
jgi:hypothetical protein